MLCGFGLALSVDAADYSSVRALWHLSGRVGMSRVSWVIKYAFAIRHQTLSL